MRLKYGDLMPEFFYDTPYQPQKSFYQLTQGETPLALIFLANFGHPVTRVYLAKYYTTFPQLASCRLAVVVRSRPQVISAAFPPGAIPFEIICDPAGALYDYFEIPTETNPYKYASIDSITILRKAQKEGYQYQKDQPQQLPLTLMVAPGGGVGLVHYGASLTDFPEDCGAIEKTAQHMEPGWMTQWEPEEEDWSKFTAYEVRKAPAEQPEEAAPAAQEAQKQGWEGPEEEEPAPAQNWMDNTAELLLDFKQLQDLPIPPGPDHLYNTTGEIDIFDTKYNDLLEHTEDGLDLNALRL